MNIQSVAVALIVGACLVYAVWALMPAAARRALAGALLRLPLPAPLAARLVKMANAAVGCGCDGCDRAPDVSPALAASRRAEQPIRFHPRPRR